MGYGAAVRSELLKIKHTAFLTIHMIIPLIGAIFFIFYYMLYQNVVDYEKLKLMLELTATVFPLLISVVVGIDIILEERASCFQALLTVKERGRILTAKLSVLFGAGVTALMGLFVLFLFGVRVMGIMGNISVMILVQAFLGVAFSNLIIYILHMFLNLKFGLGPSLFWGVFECLQCILYSNIRLYGGWKYLPFSWSVNWIRDTLQGSLRSHAIEWGICLSMTLGCFLLFQLWFSRWEGRNLSL